MFWRVRDLQPPVPGKSAIRRSFERSRLAGSTNQKPRSPTFGVSLEAAADAPGSFGMWCTAATPIWPRARDASCRLAQTAIEKPSALCMRRSSASCATPLSGKCPPVCWHLPRRETTRTARRDIKDAQPPPPAPRRRPERRPAVAGVTAKAISEQDWGAGYAAASRAIPRGVTRTRTRQERPDRQ